MNKKVYNCHIMFLYDGEVYRLPCYTHASIWQGLNYWAIIPPIEIVKIIVNECEYETI